MVSVVVGEMVDRSDLAAAVLSQDVLTVFQFHSYILEHEVQDMETHLLHLAREGELVHRHIALRSGGVPVNPTSNQFSVYRNVLLE